MRKVGSGTVAGGPPRGGPPRHLYAASARVAPTQVFLVPGVLGLSEVKAALVRHGGPPFDVVELERPLGAAAGRAVVVAGIDSRACDPVSLMRALAQLAPGVPVIAVADAGSRHLVGRALRVGVQGFLMREDLRSSLADAVRLVAEGSRYVSESLMQWILHGMASPLAGGEERPLDRLSDRELTILQFLARGLGAKSIADELRLSVKTVFTHRANIKRKIGVADDRDLRRCAACWVGAATGPARARGCGP